MTIEIAADNHIGVECKPVSKSDLKDIDKRWLIWSTLEEWGADIESGFYQDHDCSGSYSCEFEGNKYSSSIRISAGDLEDTSRIPSWATHVMWSSK